MPFELAVFWASAIDLGMANACGAAMRRESQRKVTKMVLIRLPYIVRPSTYNASFVPREFSLGRERKISAARTGKGPALRIDMFSF